GPRGVGRGPPDGVRGVRPADGPAELAVGRAGLREAVPEAARRRDAPPDRGGVTGAGRADAGGGRGEGRDGRGLTPPRDATLAARSRGNPTEKWAGYTRPRHP